MTKVLVLGATGMAGHVVATYLAENSYSVATIALNGKLNDRTELIDVSDKLKLDKYLVAHQFDVIVNCIGLLVKNSEEHKDLAVYLNSYLPHYLEKKYENSETKIIHLSTDCVFSGTTPPYKEDSLYDGQTFYDRSKALGELNNDKDLTFRMSIVGPEIQEKGIGLFHWFYAQTGEVSGYTGSIWSGITTLQLAKGIDAAIKQNLTGLYHLVPQANITKFDLLELFKSTFGRDDISIKPVKGSPFDKTLINTRTDFNFEVPDYLTMINDMRDWVYKHREMYSNYYELKD